MKDESTTVDFSSELSPAINKLLAKVDMAPAFGYSRSMIVRTFMEKTYTYLNRKDKEAVQELLKL